MAIDVATVRKVAHLARIAEPEDRLPALAQELSAILAWIEQHGSECLAAVRSAVAMGYAPYCIKRRPRIEKEAEAMGASVEWVAATAQGG